MINHLRLVAISIIAVLHTCFHNGSSRPQPGEKRTFMESWVPHSLEVPEWPQHNNDMPHQSNLESHWFPYAEILMSSPLHEYQSAVSSSHGLDLEHITNAYHHPSSSNTVSDHYFSLASHDEMWDPDWNPLSEHGPKFEKQTNHFKEMHHDQENHFAVSMLDLRFAWISLLLFPGFTKLGPLRHDDWGFRTIGNRAFNLQAIPALRDNAQTAEANLRVLLWEIDTRNKQFLLLFTPATGDGFMEILRNLPSYPDVKHENARLLEWVLRQLEPVPQLNDRRASGATSALSPFQTMLFEFLNTDWERPELTEDRWQPLLRESKEIAGKGGPLRNTATPAMASRTKVVMHALGSYYKSSNPTKFSELFEKDDYFVTNFLRMKNREHNGGSRKYQPEQLAKLKILPWPDTHQFDRDPEVARILKVFRQTARRNVEVESFVLVLPPSMPIPPSQLTPPPHAESLQFEAHVGAEQPFIHGGKKTSSEPNPEPMTNSKRHKAKLFES
ncbi:hypothetical protein PCANC_04649 [Puccinia coronata f. sp. avenae]|uniref:Uncharacterized protein n=1 Tax=Puccinia coronata f. sp. avenae TaxID=200324 RepID=A0A2N5W0C9_9BASI|nr:hypothetical protein PCANC_04649 [Puccinia coronata f. sp. avenae]